MNTPNRNLVNNDTIKHKKISIIIPAYNEEKRISDTLRKIDNFIKKEQYNTEIIVVNDGSKDGTADVVNSIKADIDNLVIINLQPNFGKGMATKIGMINATGDYLLFSDADLSTPIKELKKLIAAIDAGNDIAIGSRKMQNSVIGTKQPWYRSLMGNIFQKFIAIVMFNHFKDTQCGFKVFKKDTVNALFKHQKINGFAFDIELLFIAKKLGYKIAEIPIEWYDDEQSTVSPVKDSLKMIRDVIFIRLFYLKFRPTKNKQ